MQTQTRDGMEYLSDGSVWCVAKWDEKSRRLSIADHLKGARPTLCTRAHNDGLPSLSAVRPRCGSSVTKPMRQPKQRLLTKPDEWTIESLCRGR